MWDTDGIHLHKKVQRFFFRRRYFTSRRLQVSNGTVLKLYVRETLRGGEWTVFNKYGRNYRKVDSRNQSFDWWTEKSGTVWVSRPLFWIAPHEESGVCHNDQGSGLTRKEGSDTYCEGGSWSGKREFPNVK